VKAKYRGIIYSIAFGLCLGAIGMFLMSIVAAVAIPKEFVLWFDNNELAMYSINFVSQFLSFGVAAIAIGILLGRISKMWLLNSLVCYAACLFYLLRGTTLIYTTEIPNPFFGATYFDLPTILVLPFCLLISTFVTARKL
jgi:hypothetical protein